MFEEIVALQFTILQKLLQDITKNYVWNSKEQNIFYSQMFINLFNSQYKNHANLMCLSVY